VAGVDPTGSLARVLNGVEDLDLPVDLIMAVRHQLKTSPHTTGLGEGASSGKAKVNIGAGAPIFLAGVLQGLMKTLLKDAGRNATEPECKAGSDSEGGGKKIIIPKDIQLALRKHLTVMETAGKHIPPPLHLACLIRHVHGLIIQFCRLWRGESHRRCGEHRWHIDLLLHSAVS